MVFVITNAGFSPEVLNAHSLEAEMADETGWGAAGPPTLEQVLQRAVKLAGTFEVQVVLAFVLLFVLVELWLQRSGRKGSGSKRKTVLLVGPCNSGKTTLFHMLRDGTVHLGTVASMQENDELCRLRDEAGQPLGTVRLIDVPGHPRLRFKVEQFLREAAAVVLLVDAADITPHKTEAAEELFEVLTHAAVVRRRTPILIACNKMDLETQAHSVDFIRRTLERQLDTMRKTRLSLGSDGAKAGVLGKPDKPLLLAGLRSPISTASISAEKGDVAEVTRFLEALL